MPEKRFIFGGKAVPIEAEVVAFNEPGAWSFYPPIPPPFDVLVPAQRQNGKYYSGRKGGTSEVSPPDQDAVNAGITQVVLHCDITTTDKKCYEVLLRRGFSTHFTIGEDGVIHQLLDIAHTAWHSGDNNKQSIGIDLNNLLEIDKFKKHRGGVPEGRGEAKSMKINGGRTKVGVGYTEEQYSALIALLAGFKEVLPNFTLFYPMDDKGKVINRKIKNYADFKGFMAHWHCSAMRWDPGPAFDWERVMLGLHGQRNSFPVELAGATNLTDIYSATEANIQFKKYYNNNESSEFGGFFPIGLNQVWHGGVHFHIPQDSLVRAMAAGDIVAARNTRYTYLGSANFVVIRHSFKRKVDGEDKEMIYFTLYMHLQPQKPGDKAPKWLNTVSSQAELKTREDDDDEEIPLISMSGFDLCDDPTSFPGFARYPEALFDGNVVAFEKPIPVQSGEIIGTVGNYGPSQYELTPQVHIEVFSGDFASLFNPIDQFPPWKQALGDGDWNSRCDVRGIWEPIANLAEIPAKKRGYGITVLKADEIREFFNQEDPEARREREQKEKEAEEKRKKEEERKRNKKKKRGKKKKKKKKEPQQLEEQPKDEHITPSHRALLRRLVTFHISEWSKSVDWSTTAGTTVGWQWQTQESYEEWYKYVKPFMWYMPRMAKALGLPEEEPFMWHYHPITFLKWLFESKNRAEIGKTAVGFSDSELKEQRKQDAAAELVGEDGDVHSAVDERDVDRVSIIDIDLPDDVPIEILDDTWKEWEQGEWKLPFMEEEE